MQEEFERHVQFALDLAQSADDVTRPDSHLGNKAPNFVDDTFDVSFGNPRPVQVNARRDLGRITLRYQINGGRVRTRPTDEWDGGLRYGDEGDYWYHRVRGVVTGPTPGDSVQVWFVSRDKARGASHFTYEVRSDSGADVLVLAAEDYSGVSSFPPYDDAPAPHFLELLHGRARGQWRRVTTSRTTTRRAASLPTRSEC